MGMTASLLLTAWLAHETRPVEAFVYLHQESNLSSRLIGGAFQDLSGEMGCKRHNLASHKRVAPLISRKAQRWAFEQGSQVERRQGVENDDFMSRIGID